MSLPTIPRATKKHRRTLCEQIRTEALPAERGAWVVATYETKQTYLHPTDAPVFAHMTWRNATAPAIAGAWQGHVLLQTFALNEGRALAQLLDTLRMTGLHVLYPPVEWARLESITHDLQHTTLSTPWEQRPFPRVGVKPKRKRTKWRDETGRRINIYTDTTQRYAHLPPRIADQHAEEEHPTHAADGTPPSDPVPGPGHQ